jgi:predicted NUDIX family phosphoesterase
MTKKEYFRNLVEPLLARLDSRLITVLDDYVKQNGVKGWTRYHDELNVYPIGEYNDHLQWLIVEGTPELAEDSVVKAGSNEGWEYRVGKFVKRINSHNGKNYDEYCVYESKGCVGKNMPPAVWDMGIVRMNTSGFVDGDGLDTFKDPDTKQVFKPGEKCPVCGAWGETSILIQLPDKDPAHGYCPRQVRNLYGNLPKYKNVLEQVLVVKAVEVDGWILPDQLTPWTEDTAKRFNDALSKAEWKQRSVVENDPTYRQIIPYVVVRNEKTGDVFCYRRNFATGADNEQRLDEQYSIGVGGHINPCDANNNLERHDMLSVEIAATRELLEELTFNASGETESVLMPLSFPWLGFVRDTMTDVGRVHLGLVGVWELPEEVCEKMHKPGSKDFWSKVNYLPFSNMEMWSDIAINYFNQQQIEE